MCLIMQKIVGAIFGELTMPSDLPIPIVYNFTPEDYI